SLDMKVYPIGVTRHDLEGMVDGFRRLVAERNLSIKTKAGALYDVLIKPVENELHDVSTLCILPDGPLWQLPFQVLYHSRGYLLETYSIYYAHSLTALRDASRNRSDRRQTHSRPDRNSPELFAIANPTVDPEMMTRLGAINRAQVTAPGPEEEREVAALGRLYGQANSRILTRNGAREDTLKAEAGNYRVLHVAAHSILDDRNPMYSGLLLSRTGAQDDGVLEAWEIMRLSLKAELVVLSGCETA